MPFVTETLWKTLTGGESLVIADWPTPVRHRAGSRCDAADHRHAEADHRGPQVPQRPGPQRPAAGACAAGRGRRGRSGRPGRCGRRAGLADRARRRLHSVGGVEVRLSRGTVVVELDTSGTVDVAAERRRLEKDLAAAEKELAQTAAKLGNEAFLAKAPDDVVDKIRARQQLAAEEVERITGRLAGLRDMHQDVDRLKPTPDEIAALLQVEHLLDQRWPETKIEPSTARIAALLELLGSPQRAYPSIHVAGTNGKTSVARMIDSLLTALHRRTGRTTSPHLQSAVERISIDGRPISPAQYVETYREIEPFVEMVDAQSEAAGGPRMSKFEVLTAMAFAAFADAPVDVAVVEVGLGGRWDATNVDQRTRRRDHPHRHRPRRLPRRHHRRDRRRRRPESSPSSEDDLVPEGHRRGDRAADARGHGGVAGAGASAPMPRWPARTPSSRCCAREVAIGGQLLELQGLGGVYSDIFLPLHGEHQAHNAVRGAGRGRGVLRRWRRPSARRRRGSGRLRVGGQPRSTGANAKRPNGVHRRSTQSGGRGRAGDGVADASSTSAFCRVSSR